MANNIKDENNLYRTTSNLSLLATFAVNDVDLALNTVPRSSTELEMLILLLLMSQDR